MYLFINYLIVYQLGFILKLNDVIYEAESALCNINKHNLQLSFYYSNTFKSGNYLHFTFAASFIFVFQERSLKSGNRQSLR